MSGAGAWTLCDCLARRTPDTEQAVMFAPDGWDERTQSPVDEQAESLRDADPPPEPDTVIAECACWVTPEWQWTKHYSAVEPGSQWEPNPDCPVHFPRPPWWVCAHCGLMQSLSSRDLKRSQAQSGGMKRFASASM